jgi:hypothetical protein
MESAKHRKVVMSTGSSEVRCVLFHNTSGSSTSGNATRYVMAAYHLETCKVRKGLTIVPTIYDLSAGKDQRI